MTEREGVCWATDLFNRSHRPEDALRSSTLQGILQQDCPGARVVLLDVSGDSKHPDSQAWEQIGAWPDGVAVLRVLSATPEATTAQGRLLGVWEEGVHRTQRLQQMADFIERALRSGEQPSPQPPFRQKLSPPLRYLPVGAGT